MQGNGNQYGGRPYDPFAQERPMQYETRQQTRGEKRQGAQYPMMEDGFAAPQQRQPRPQQQMPQRRPMDDPRAQMPRQQMADPRAQMPRQQMADPRAQMPRQQMTEPAPQMELDVAEPAAVYESASHGTPFAEDGHKMRSAVIACVMTLVLASSGFVVSRVRAAKAADKAAQNAQQSVALEDIDPTQQVIPVEAANVTFVQLNTATPAFGSARLQITFEVDADAVVRIQIVDAAGNVFYTVEENLEVAKGKLRTYFDGKDAQGNWIPIGSYQVRVSALVAPLNAEGEPEEDLSLWTVDNAKTADFAVNADARPTQNSRPAIIATPTPSPSPSPEVSEDPNTSPSPDASTTPTPSAPPESESTPTATPTPTPTPESTPTPPPVDGGADAPPID